MEEANKKGALPRFQGLVDFDLKDVLGTVTSEYHQAGALVWRAGDRSDRMFVLISGEAALEELDEQITRVDSAIKKNRFVSEMIPQSELLD